MPYSDSCREKILSEDYRDFIVSDIRMPFLQDLLKKDYCFQNPGFFINVLTFQNLSSILFLWNVILIFQFQNATPCSVCRR